LRHILSAYYLISFVTVFCSCNLGLTKCEDVQEWTIENYRIVESRCLGPAGPPYYPLSVFKGSKSLGTTAFQKNSCTITFQAKSDQYLFFDICNNKLTELKPDKKQIDIALVDSIKMFSNQLNENKLLSKKSSEKFIKDWNNSKTSDYRDKPIDSVFYPTYQYKLTVYTKKGLREFLGANYLISDRTQWTFYINADEDIEYFNKLWTR
jgi:hypothetical protein